MRLYARYTRYSYSIPTPFSKLSFITPIFRERRSKGMSDMRTQSRVSADLGISIPASWSRSSNAESLEIITSLTNARDARARDV